MSPIEDSWPASIPDQPPGSRRPGRSPDARHGDWPSQTGPQLDRFGPRTLPGSQSGRADPRSRPVSGPHTSPGSGPYARPDSGPHTSPGSGARSGPHPASGRRSRAAPEYGTWPGQERDARAAADYGSWPGQDRGPRALAGGQFAEEDMRRPGAPRRTGVGRGPGRPATRDRPDAAESMDTGDRPRGRARMPGRGGRDTGGPTATRDRQADYHPGRAGRADYPGRDAPPDGRRGRRDAQPERQPAEPAPDVPRRRGAAASRGRKGLSRSRIWLWAGAAGLVVVISLVVAWTLLLGHSRPSHVLVTPARLGAYVRSPQLEQQMGARNLQQQVISKSGGQASHVIYAVYQNNAAASGGSPQVILFIGGHLSGVSPSGFISSFSTQFKGARSTSPGSMGGSAACVNANANVTGQVALCTWADNDTFGVVASPTMSAAQLAAQMRVIRPQVEHAAR